MPSVTARKGSFVDAEVPKGLLHAHSNGSDRIGMSSPFLQDRTAVLALAFDKFPRIDERWDWYLTDKLVDAPTLSFALRAKKTLVDPAL